VTLVVYIAHPIGANDAGRPARLAAAREVCVELLRAGFAPIFPGSFALSIPDADDVLGYEGWMRVCFALLDKADALLRMPGESPGADREEAHALHHGIPVFTSIEALVAAQVAA
jgi:hypothetical protein